MSRKTFLGVVLALMLATVAYAAGDRIYAFKAAAYDDIPIGSPCGPVRAASMTVYDGNAWVVFTCTSGEVVLRRYLNPNDSAGTPPVAVYTVPAPTHNVDLPSAAGETCAVPGMVTGIYGGCVPVDHPNAPKNYGNQNR